MTVHVVKQIKGTTWITRHAKLYKKTHKEANRREKKMFGSRKYHALNKAVNKLKSGHLAASISKDGRVKVSKEILNKFHAKDRVRVKKQLEYHERQEKRLFLNELKHKKRNHGP